MIMMDILQGNITLANEGNIVSSSELKKNNKEEWQFYKNVKCALEAYMIEHNDTRFDSCFKSEKCNERLEINKED